METYNEKEISEVYDGNRSLKVSCPEILEDTRSVENDWVLKFRYQKEYITAQTRIESPHQLLREASDTMVNPRVKSKAADFGFVYFELRICVGLKNVRLNSESNDTGQNDSNSLL